MIFQHDGAPPHYTRWVNNFLYQTYSRWYQVSFYGGMSEERVYKDNISNITHSEQKIMEEFEKLKKKNDISLHSVQISFVRRANLCMQQRGGHFLL